LHHGVSPGTEEDAYFHAFANARRHIVIETLQRHMDSRYGPWT
jgi:hypothetical protein